MVSLSSLERQSRLGLGSLQRNLFGRYLLPARTGVEIARSILARRPDAYICSYPRSGRTWISYCLAAYLREYFDLRANLSLSNYTGYVPNADDPPDSPFGIDSFLFADLLQVPMIATSHAPYKKGRFGEEIILVLREPHDVMVSYYFFLTTYLHRVECGFADFLRGNTDLAAIGMPSPVYALSRYLDSWVEPVLSGAVTVTTYEAWHASPEEELTKLLTILRLPRRELLVAKECVLSDADHMRLSEQTEGAHFSAVDITKNQPEDLGSRNPDARFVRRASVGSWRTELTTHEATLLDEALDRQLTRRTKKMMLDVGLGYKS